MAQSSTWVQLFIEQVKVSKPIEWMASLTGVAEVLLARKNSVWLYPAGLISTALYVYILLQFGLYAEAILSLYYFIMSIYGWYNWLRKKEGGATLAISYTTASEWGITSGIILGAGVLLFYVLKTYTPSTVPIWDAWVAATGWAGMWLLARRKVENWLVLNISNICAIPLYIHKKLPLTAVLTLILFIVAIFGYIEWRKILSKQLKES